MSIRKFRKKPVVIEAIQWTGDNHADIIEFVGDTWLIAINDVNHTVALKTLEGHHIASLNDWIIQGVEGEFYACKPRIFKKTYEEVQE